MTDHPTSHATDSSVDPAWNDSLWPYAALVGVLAGLFRPVVVEVTALLGISYGDAAPLLPTDASLWWVIHLAYGFVFAAAFAVAVWHSPLRTYAVNPVTGALLGVGYGALLWAVNVALVWNVLLADLVWVATAPPSAFQLEPIVGHLGYGLLVGALYPVVRRLATK